MWDEGAERRERGPSVLLSPFRSCLDRSDASGSAVMSADTFAFRDHTRAHDIRPGFTNSTPIMSFLSPSLPTHIQRVHIPELHRSDWWLSVTADV